MRTQIGTRRSKPAYPADRTVTSSTVHPICAFAVGPRTWIRFQKPVRSALAVNAGLFFCRFQIVNDGSLAVTIGPRQAIAVHTGALGNGMGNPTAQQVSVMFSEYATTILGEVSALWLAGSLVELPV
jgi:hypothetical protein